MIKVSIYFYEGNTMEGYVEETELFDFENNMINSVIIHHNSFKSPKYELYKHQIFTLTRLV